MSALEPMIRETAGRRPQSADDDEAARGFAWSRVIGLPVIAGTMDAVTDGILARAGGAEGGYVCVANVHMLVTARRDPRFRPVVEQAPLVVSDSRPLVWELHRQGLTFAEQLYGPLLMVELCRKAAAEGTPVFFYGGDDQVRDALVSELARRFPALRIAGAEAAPLLPAEPPLDPALVGRIRASGARLVFAALGCPKQEFWMRRHAPELDAVLLGVGQAFNVVAGTLPDAPDWMRARGLGWLYRLAREPRRLWRRYVVTNSLFLGYLARERLSARFHRAAG